RVAQVEQDRIQAGADASFTHGRLDLDQASRAAHRRDGRAPGRLRAHAPGDVAVGERVHGGADLRVQLALERVLAKQRVPEARQSRDDAHLETPGVKVRYRTPISEKRKP